MIKVFLDTEFTHLAGPLDPEPAELISIGCIADNSQKFYAENSSFDAKSCSEFVVETVLPLLEGNDISLPYFMIAKQLKVWIESFTDKVTIYTDSPYHDYGYIQHMFDNWGWPSNLVREPKWLVFEHIKGAQFGNAVEHAFRSFTPALRRHHALDDAIANRYAYEVVAARRY